MGVADEARKGQRVADMEKVLAYLVSGCTIAESMRRTGRGLSTYAGWKKVSPEFGARAEKILERRQKGYINEAVDKKLDIATLEGFRKHYFGYETFPHQKKMIDAIEQAPPGSVTMILMPPEWMKTTTVTDYICKRLAENPNVRICDISEGKGHAAKTLGRIQRRMTDRSLAAAYIDDFGPFRAPDRAMQKPWNAEFFTVVRATHDEQDYSLECRGSASNIYGSRYDLVILDDIQSRKSIGSTQRLVDMFRQDWRTRPGKNGKLIIIGTRVGKGDFYEELLKLGLVTTLVRIPALDEHQKSNFPAVFDENGVRMTNAAGDPLGWTEEELVQRRFEVGPEIWDRVYMQLGRSASGGSFTDTMIERAFDNDRGCGGRQRGHKGVGRMSGLDPALGGYAGYVSCSYDSNFLYVEGIRNEPGLQRYEEIFAILEQETIEHLPECWIIERNGMQKGLPRDDNLIALRDRYGFYIHEHFTGDNKIDDKIGIPSMAGAMNRGEIRFPGTPEARQLMQPLIDELLDWRWDVPAKLLRQDLVLALWFVYLRWQTVRATLEQDLSCFDRSGSPSYTSYQTTLGTFR